MVSCVLGDGVFLRCGVEQRVTLAWWNCGVVGGGDVPLVEWGRGVGGVGRRGSARRVLIPKASLWGVVLGQVSCWVLVLRQLPCGSLGYAGLGGRAPCAAAGGAG